MGSLPSDARRQAPCCPDDRRRDVAVPDRCAENPPVNFEQLLLPVSDGGLGLLDLSARNEAIDITWLREYLAFGELRPLWAHVADDLFAMNVAQSASPADPALRINPFLQHWKPLRKGLPGELLALLDVARAHHLRLEGRAFSRDIMRAMPMWDHLQTSKTAVRTLGSRSAATACLKNVHCVVTVGHFEALAAEANVPGHSRQGGCDCDRCTHLRNGLGCAHPQRCYERAERFLNLLPRKWDPRGEHPCDFEDATMADTKDMFPVESGVPVVFDRRITVSGTLADAFRIFERGVADDGTAEADMSVNDREGFEVVATDGSCTNNGFRDAVAGAGVFFTAGSVRNRSIRLPMEMEQSNQAGEAVAAVVASKESDQSVALLQITDSKTTMDAVTRWRHKNEDSGFIMQKNSELTRALIGATLARQAHTAFLWVKGHNGHPGNEAADALAGAGAAKPNADQFHLAFPQNLALTGAKLSTVTQKLAYRAIRLVRAKDARPRASAEARLETILSDLQD
ncbi:hypothetical protein C2E23DRAFT_589749, partial [Lenzites betulinus]